MNDNNILKRAVQALGNQPVIPFVEQTTLKNIFTRSPNGIDPGSLYGSFKKNPKETMMNAVMGLSTPTVPFNKMANISTADRNIMGQLVSLVEQGKGKGNLGAVGRASQSIAEGLGLPPTITNNLLSKYFNKIIQQADSFGINPIKE